MKKEKVWKIKNKINLKKCLRLREDLKYVLNLNTGEWKKCEEEEKSDSENIVFNYKRIDTNEEDNKDIILRKGIWDRVDLIIEKLEEIGRR